jgi:hypothetical protein
MILFDTFEKQVLVQRRTIQLDLTAEQFNSHIKHTIYCERLQ